MRSMGLLLATVALMASLLQSQAAAQPRRAADAQKTPQTLYSSPSGTIAAFAQDGQLLAWFAPSAKRCNSIHLLSLANAGLVVLPDERPSARNVTCQWDVAQPVHLALSGTSVLWTLRDKLSPLPFDYLLGASSVDPRERRFEEIAHAGHGAGLWFGGIAGDSKIDGSSLVYAVTAVAYHNELACLSKSSCEMRISDAGSGVFRVVGRQWFKITGTSAAIDVAVSGSSVAYIRTASVGPNGEPHASASLPIEIRDSETGQPRAGIIPKGTPLAVALSPSVLATLERTKLGTRLAWYDAATGAPSGSVPVPAATAPELTASDQLVVFRVGRSIRAANVLTHRVLTLAHAAAIPVGLSLEGTRLAWAENIRGHGRIRALFVGGRG